MTAAATLRHRLDLIEAARASRAEFARGGGGAKSAKAGGKGKAAKDKAKKGKGAVQAGKGGACCKTEGGRFAKGNNYGSLSGKGTSQRAAARRVGERLAAKSKGAQLDRAARQANVRVEATRRGAGPVAAMVAKSKAAAVLAAREKAKQEKQALDKKQAKNAKARERRAEKKEAAAATRGERVQAMGRKVAELRGAAKAKAAEAGKPSRDTAIRRLASKSQGATLAGATAKAQREAAKSAKAKATGRGTAERAAKAAELKESRFLVERVSKSTPITEGKVSTYGGRKTVELRRGVARVTVEQVAKGSNIYEVKNRYYEGSGTKTQSAGTYEGLKAAKAAARENLQRVGRVEAGGKLAGVRGTKAERAARAASAKAEASKSSRAAALKALTRKSREAAARAGAVKAAPISAENIAAKTRAAKKAQKRDVKRTAAQPRPKPEPVTVPKREIDRKQVSKPLRGPGSERFEARAASVRTRPETMGRDVAKDVAKARAKADAGRGTPERAAKAVAKRVERAADTAIREMAKDYPSGLVPIPVLRDRLAAKLGPTAAGKALDRALLEGKHGGNLVAISDLRKATKEQLAKAVPGVNETLYYVRVPKAATPTGGMAAAAAGRAAALKRATNKSRVASGMAGAKNAAQKRAAAASAPVTRGIGGREPDLRNVAPAGKTSAAARVAEARGTARERMVRASREAAQGARMVAQKRAAAAGGEPSAARLQADKASALKALGPKPQSTSSVQNDAATRSWLERKADIEISHVPPVAPPPPSLLARPVSDPARLKAESAKLDEAFARSPGARDNFVPIAAVQKAMPHLSRPELIAVINKGRDDGKYGLDSSEGQTRNDSPLEKAAAIQEGGSRLIFISRRDR